MSICRYRLRAASSGRRSLLVDGSRFNSGQGERFKIQVGPEGKQDILTESAVIVDRIPISSLDHKTIELKWL